MSALYRYVADFDRLRWVPSAGPHATVSQCIRVEFPFGKNQELKTGAEAMAKAEQLAEEMMQECTSVSVSRMHGGSGTTRYLKRGGQVFWSRFPGWAVDLAESA